MEPSRAACVPRAARPHVPNAARADALRWCSIEAVPGGAGGVCGKGSGRGQRRAGRPCRRGLGVGHDRCDRRGFGAVAGGWGCRRDWRCGRAVARRRRAHGTGFGAGARFRRVVRSGVGSRGRRPGVGDGTALGAPGVVFGASGGAGWSGAVGRVRRCAGTASVRNERVRCGAAIRRTGAARTVSRSAGCGARGWPGDAEPGGSARPCDAPEPAGPVRSARAAAGAARPARARVRAGRAQALRAAAGRVSGAASRTRRSSSSR